MFKGVIAKLLAKATGLLEGEIDSLLEIPPSPELGDFAFPCFILAKSLKKAPNIIAQELSKKLKPKAPISEVKAVGAYLNFFVDKSKLSTDVIKNILNCAACYGSWPLKKEKVMIEYPAPNTNKPLHLGHVRNMLLGNSICNILAFAGYQAIPVNYVNDRGVHICKSMLAYQKWGKNKQPDKKSDHFVGDFYVMFSQKAKEHPELEEETQELLRRWEAGDKELVALWKKMNRWALDGFNDTYKKFDVHHKKTYFESEIYNHGKEIILEGLKKGLFSKDEDGAIIADLENDGLGKKVLIRKDGTAIYITTDIYLAKLKFDDFKMDKSVYIVGSEQIYHFKVLFKLLDMLGFPFAKNCYHLAYGLISLPEGRMKSREGTIVDGDDILEEMKKEAEEEVKKRHAELKKNEVDKRKEIIGKGALKFFILKYDPMKDFTYDPKESISFEGETGPYVQYAHARICSILRNVKKFEPEKIKPEFNHKLELRLITLLADFPRIVSEAAEQYKPSLVARYTLDLAQAFNEFYHECPVLKAEKKVMESRLVLILCVKQVIKNALDLLGIQSPEEM